ncbi:SSI family serine proteinase inhibitor [Streptomyces fractus]|uniref:SSI family serine proteinase inhibitor n=1 Tax=Streptomyces fractus TaxID=641806 RepID=UPI003CEA5FC7
MAMTQATKVGRALLASAALAAMLGAGAGTALANAPEKAENWMYVAVAKGDSEPGKLQHRVLQCGKWFSDPAVYRACGQLKKSDGLISKIPAKDKACPMIYKPVTAMAYGKWEGRSVSYSAVFPNECVMHAKTGAVFKTL